jgi:hypothetical protein
MKYCVSSDFSKPTDNEKRDAYYDLRISFFKSFTDDYIELSDQEVIAVIIKYGRATIEERPDGTRRLTFQNDYD